LSKIVSSIQTAIFLPVPFDGFSRHSREQYTDDPERAPIARSDGIQIPQLTQRTSFLSAFVVEPLNGSPAFGAVSAMFFAAPKIF
jgi:hypothetical protein